MKIDPNACVHCGAQTISLCPTCGKHCPPCDDILKIVESAFVAGMREAGNCEGEEIQKLHFKDWCHWNPLPAIIHGTGRKPTAGEGS